jgi:co-chaperonin GroES (HSP10)
MSTEPKPMFSPHKIERAKFRVIHDQVIVHDMTFDERITTGGIVLLNDNGKSNGIRPRWGRVYAVGSKQKDVHVGQWVLVAHGRWTRGLDIEDENGKQTVRKIDPNDILLVSDSPDSPGDETFSDAVYVPNQTLG